MQNLILSSADVVVVFTLSYFSCLQYGQAGRATKTIGTAVQSARCVECVLLLVSIFHPAADSTTALLNCPRWTVNRATRCTLFASTSTVLKDSAIPLATLTVHCDSIAVRCETFAPLT